MLKIRPSWTANIELGNPMNNETSHHHGTYIIIGDDEDYTPTITSASTYDTCNSALVVYVNNYKDALIEYFESINWDEVNLYIDHRQDSINGILDSCHHDRKLHNQIDRKPFKRMRRKAIFHFGRSAPGIRKD